MQIAETTDAWLAAQLRGAGLGLDLGAACVRIRSDVPELPAMLRRVYGGYAADQSAHLFDVTVNLQRAHGLRRRLRPQVELIVDGGRDFEPFPRDTPLPLLEWGMNYALATRLYCYLLLHSGVVERDGRAVLLPAMPGSGKSTLTAALSLRGFRLLSDEFGVVHLDDALVRALLRPVALKNESIDVIAGFAQDAVVGPRFPKTHKGTVAHLAPSAAHVARRHTTASAALVVFPRFDARAGVEVKPVSKARAFARLAVNSFNYEVLSPDAFDALGRVVQQSACYEMRYGDLERAVKTIGTLLEEATRPGGEPPASNGMWESAQRAQACTVPGSALQ